MEYELPSTFVNATATTYSPDSRVVDQLNKVLRGELSAVAAYDQVIEKFANEPEIYRLSAIREEHVDSVRALRTMITHEGAFPDDEPGLWGTIVKAVVGTGKIFGNSPALTALKQGEEYGLRLYEDLATENLNSEDLRVIRSKLIPRQEKHIALLDQLAKMQ